VHNPGGSWRRISFLFPHFPAFLVYFCFLCVTYFA
jgi:hypothetical protein